MATDAVTETLASWWTQFQQELTSRSIPLAPGGIDGADLPIVSLDPADGLAIIPALLDGMKPQACLWVAATDGDDGIAGYRVGLLSSAGWNIVECGTPTSPAPSLGNTGWLYESDDEDDADGREAQSRARERAESVVADTAKALAGEIKVGDPHDRDVLERLLKERVHEAVSDDAELRACVADLHYWTWSHTIGQALIPSLKDHHIETIYNDAERFATHVQTEDPGIENQSIPVRRNRVYQILKKVDPCITKDSSIVVCDALNRLLARREASLFE